MLGWEDRNSACEVGHLDVEHFCVDLNIYRWIPALGLCCELSQYMVAWSFFPLKLWLRPLLLWLDILGAICVLFSSLRYCALCHLFLHVLCIWKQVFIIDGGTSGDYTVGWKCSVSHIFLGPSLSVVAHSTSMPRVWTIWSWKEALSAVVRKGSQEENIGSKAIDREQPIVHGYVGPGWHSKRHSDIVEISWN